MSMTVREVVEHLYRYLRKEQRELPMTDPDLDDPLPEALVAINATLQRLAVRSPKFAVQRPQAALFHAPAMVAVTGLTREGTVATCAAWPEWAAGCVLVLPGDVQPNRILSVAGQVATLQFPHLSDEGSGQATIRADSVNLGAQVISVLPPVRLRGGAALQPANGKRELARCGVAERGDFGRLRRVNACADGRRFYYVDSVMLAGMPGPQLRLRLAEPVTADVVVEFDARCSLGWMTPNHVYDDSPVPVPAEYVESLFLPLALLRFFGSSVMRNTDAPPFVTTQAQEAEELLQAMRPQAEKHFRLYPGL